jgi:hypothetical protein
MTVSIHQNHRYMLLGGVKQLQRRRLPTRARLTNNRKLALSTKAKATNQQVEIIITPSRRLNSLRRTYTRRGVPSTGTSPRRVSISEQAPRPSGESKGVLQVSLAGAKRSYAQLDVPSDEEYESDSSTSSCLSLVSSSMMNTFSYNRYTKPPRRRIRTVQFATLCSVVEIPHYCEYTTMQKMAMWNGSKKIRMMAKRNSAEFQFDGWNVENAAEEDKFVIVDGKSVHPVYAASEESSDTPTRSS